MTLKMTIKELRLIQPFQIVFRTENVVGKSVSTRKSTRARPSAEGATAKPATAAIKIVQKQGRNLESA